MAGMYGITWAIPQMQEHHVSSLEPTREGQPSPQTPLQRSLVDHGAFTAKTFQNTNSTMPKVAIKPDIANDRILVGVGQHRVDIAMAQVAKIKMHVSSDAFWIVPEGQANARAESVIVLEAADSDWRPGRSFRQMLEGRFPDELFEEVDRAEIDAALARLTQSTERYRASLRPYVSAAQQRQIDREFQRIRRGARTRRR